MLRNHFFVPKHKLVRKTVRFVRLMTGFNVGEWVKEILDPLAISSDIRINIGFSFVGKKWVKHQIPEYIYFYAAQELSSIKALIRTKADSKKFLEDLQQQNYSDFLEQTFLETDSGDPFANSGIAPHLLIACYMWITK